MSEQSDDLQQELQRLLSKSDDIRAQVTELNSEIARIAGVIAKRDGSADGLVMGTLLDHASAASDGTGEGFHETTGGLREAGEAATGDGAIARGT